MHKHLPYLKEYICQRCEVSGRADSKDWKCWFCGKGDQLSKSLWTPKEKAGSEAS